MVHVLMTVDMIDREELSLRVSEVSLRKISVWKFRTDNGNCVGVLINSILRSTVS